MNILVYFCKINILVLLLKQKAVKLFFIPLLSLSQIVNVYYCFVCLCFFSIDFVCFFNTMHHKIKVKIKLKQ